MLRVLWCRNKPLVLSHRRILSPTRSSSPISLLSEPSRHSALRVSTEASIWHGILPYGCAPVRRLHGGACGEGSWNVAWDVRPARWIHRVDLAWLLFGVCACLAAPIQCADVPPQPSPVATDARNDSEDLVVFKSEEGFVKFKVTGVKADGRCLFRAIAHVACVRNGESAPDENRQRELADNLRVKVANELLKRRKQTKGFIEEDFDVYVNRIRESYVWGGEPELLMASHVLKMPISVFTVDKSSANLKKIADYGEEYQNNKENSITILFHGYGHYDILEAVPDQNDSILEVI